MSLRASVDIRYIIVVKDVPTKAFKLPPYPDILQQINTLPTYGNGRADHAIDKLQFAMKIDTRAPYRCDTPTYIPKYRPTYPKKKGRYSNFTKAIYIPWWNGALAQRLKPDSRIEAYIWTFATERGTLELLNSRIGYIVLRNCINCCFGKSPSQSTDPCDRYSASMAGLWFRISVALAGIMRHFTIYPQVHLHPAKKATRCAKKDGSLENGWYPMLVVKHR